MQNEEKKSNKFTKRKLKLEKFKKKAKEKEKKTKWMCESIEKCYRYTKEKRQKSWLRNLKAENRVQNWYKKYHKSSKNTKKRRNKNPGFVGILISEKRKIS